MNSILDTIRIAVASLRAKKARSILSMLGIVIGILNVAVLLSVAFGVRKEIVSGIEGLGSDLVIVLPGKMSESGTPNFSAQVGASTLTEADVDAIRIAAPEARNLSAAMLLAGSVRAGSESLDSALLLAATPGFEHVFGYRIADGRLLTDADEHEKGRVVVLGSAVAQALFSGRKAAGSSVEIRGETFAVVGTVAEVPAGVSFGGPDFNSMVWMPLATGWELTGSRQIFRIALQAPDAESVPALRDRVKAALFTQHGGEEDFSVFTQDDLVGLVSRILDVFAAMLAAISAIALLVGGISIMNIMLVAVSERTREIGIRKAVGATRRAILLQFLVESAFLTTAGGVVAVTVFSVGVWIVAPRLPFPLEADPVVLGFALLFSAAVGVVFGILPALRASRMDPIQALRYE